jgi:hypothetical protein
MDDSGCLGCLGFIFAVWVATLVLRWIGLL